MLVLRLGCLRGLRACFCACLAAAVAVASIPFAARSPYVGGLAALSFFSSSHRSAFERAISPFATSCRLVAYAFLSRLFAVSSLLFPLHFDIRFPLGHIIFFSHLRCLVLLCSLVVLLRLRGRRCYILFRRWGRTPPRLLS